METPNLDAIRDEALALSPTDVRVYSTADRHLDTTARISLKLLTPARREKLAEIGFPVDSLDGITTLAAALGELNGELGASASVRTGNKRAAVVEQAIPIRDNLVRACRYFLRHLGGIDIKLDALADSTGALDLANDLVVLAALVESNATAFAPNPTFDVSAQVKTARSAAFEIREVVSDIEADIGNRPETDLRNRVATLLRRRLRDVAAACEFAMPNDTELLERFARAR